MRSFSYDSWIEDYILLSCDVVCKIVFQGRLEYGLV